MFLLLLPQNVPSWTTYYILLRSHLFQLLIETLSQSLLLNVSIVSLILYLPSTSSLVLLSDASSSDIYCIHPYIFLYPLSSLTTSYYFHPQLLIFQYIFNTKSPSICHSLPLNTLTNIFISDPSITTLAKP